MKLKPWKILKSKYVLKNRWLKVRENDYKTSSGVNISKYYIAEYPNWVHMVVLDNKKRILITRQYRPAAKRVFFELPCGTIDKRDKNPLSAAKRELLEETGYTGNFKFAGKTFVNPGIQTNSIYTYLITNPKQKIIPKYNPKEVLEYEFIKLQEVIKLINKGEFGQAIHVSSLFLALKKARVYK